MAAMAKPEPSIFDLDDEASIAEGEADIAAGRLISHEKVREWLSTWGTPEEGPPPAEWGLDD